MGLNGLTVAWPAVRAQLRKAGGWGAMLLVAVPSTSPVRGAAALTACRAAWRAADSIVASGLRVCTAVTSSPKGPVLSVSGQVGSQTVLAWLGAFEAELAKTGVEGTIRAPSQRRPDRSVPFQRLYAVRCAYPTLMGGLRMLAYPPIGDHAGLLAQVSPEVAQHLAGPLVGWAAGLADSTGFGRLSVLGADLEQPGLEDWLSASIGHTLGTTCLDFFVDDQPAARRICISQRGQLIVQGAEAARPWGDVVDDLRSQMLTAAPVLDVAHLRNAMVSVSGWKLLDYPDITPGHAPPNLKAREYLANRHLWDRTVLDAHGVQLVTTGHLERANDLTAWDVQEVGQDRYLVQAADLHPWFAVDAPDPDVLAQARSDFGDMIISWHDVETEPGPYTENRGGVPTPFLWAP
jgi:hypothetical protein